MVRAGMMYLVALYPSMLPVNTAIEHIKTKLLKWVENCSKSTKLEILEERNKLGLPFVEPPFDLRRYHHEEVAFVVVGGSCPTSPIKNSDPWQEEEGRRDEAPLTPRLPNCILPWPPTSTTGSVDKGYSASIAVDKGTFERWCLCSMDFQEPQSFFLYEEGHRSG